LKHRYGGVGKIYSRTYLNRVFGNPMAHSNELIE
jgi:hypothetical protein